MNFTKPLLFFYRSDLITLSTMTYTSIQGLGFSLRYCFRNMLGRGKE